jgi:hypothetical protein
MIKFPSATSAALTGLFVTPLLFIGMNYIKLHKLGNAAFLVWAALTFFFLVAVSVTDFSYWKRRVKEQRSIFRPMASQEDFKQFYVPAWGRMFVWFVASIISVGVMALLGLV